MADFSRSPLDQLVAGRTKGYVGVHVEQGVPVLDRDLNLLNDLVSATVRSIVGRYVGDGIPLTGDGFRIVAIPAANDFRILAAAAGPGMALVGGIEVTVSANTTYAAQPGVPPLTTPTAAQPDPRIDTVYLDVFLRDVEGTEDADLLNLPDVGMQTSVRQIATWVVRVAEAVPVRAPAPGHAHYPIARLTRPLGDPNVLAGMIEDLRHPMAPLTDLERRLRAVEVLLLLPQFDPPGNQFSVVIGFGGTPVTLNGTNFAVGGTPDVLFGSVPAVVDSASSTEIDTTVPNSLPAGFYHVTVTTASGQVTSDDQFQVLVVAPPPAPAFTPPEFSPVIGFPGSPITLFGTNFDGGGAPTVLFDGTPATLNGPVTATQIPVLVPVGLSSGGVHVSVTTSGGTAISSGPFTVL
jgi:hypothetical protein